MYVIETRHDEKYGIVVVIERADYGIENPFMAVQEALRQRRMNAVGKKIRMLIDGQVMIPSQTERWQREEYQSLPKCQGCAKILSGEVYAHNLCGASLFCGKDCADQAYSEQLEKMKDEEEIEYLV